MTTRQAAPFATSSQVTPGHLTGQRPALWTYREAGLFHGSLSGCQSYLSH